MRFFTFLVIFFLVSVSDAKACPLTPLSNRIEWAACIAIVKIDNKPHLDTGRKKHLVYNLEVVRFLKGRHDAKVLKIDSDFDLDDDSNKLHLQPYAIAFLNDETNSEILVPWRGRPYFLAFEHTSQFQAFVNIVNDYVTLSAIGDVAERGKLKREWLVKCAENRLTRGDVGIEKEADFFRELSPNLFTPGQKHRMSSVFFSIRYLEAEDFDLIPYLPVCDRSKILNHLIRQMNSASDYTAAIVMNEIVRFTKDSELELMYKRDRDFMRSDPEHRKLIRQFIKRVRALSN